MAAFLGSIHHEVPVHPMDIADNIEWLVQSYGEPFTSGLHTAFLRDIANSGVSLLFNGAGGDGWYLGKHNHFGLRFTSLPKALQAVPRLGLPLVCRSKSKRAEQLATILAWSPTAYHAHFHLGITTQDFRSQLYRNSSWMPESNLRRNALFSDAAKDYEGATAHDKLIFLHAQFYLAENVFYWNHCWSRVHDLASRSPYFDAKLMDFVFSLPRMNLNKNEIRQLAATLIPRDMAYKSKSAQALPIGHWFRGPLKDFLRDNLSPERVRTSGLFNNSVVQRVIEDHIKGAGGFGMALWAMLTIVVWQNLVSQRALASEAPTRSASAGEPKSANFC